MYYADQEDLIPPDSVASSELLQQSLKVINMI